MSASAADTGYGVTKKMWAVLAVLLTAVTLSGCTFAVYPWAGTFARWNACGPINVYINPGPAGGTGLWEASVAVTRLRDASGLPLVYAGTTDQVPASWNDDGYQPGVGNRIVFAYAAAGQTDLIAGGDFGYGGARWDARGHIYHGYAVVQADRMADMSSQARITADMHELGHTVGLGHPDEGGQVMDHIPGRWDGQWSDGDLAGLRLVSSGRSCP